MGDCSDPADHLVWERWQFIDLRIQGGMFVRSSGEGAAKMHVSRFDVLVTLGLRDLHRVVGGGARWVAENLHATLSSAASHRKMGWSPRADSNRRPSPYQECALRESATPEGLVASAASSPTRPGNRQVALQLCWCVYHQGFKARGSNPGRASTSVFCRRNPGMAGNLVSSQRVDLLDGRHLTVLEYDNRKVRIRICDSPYT